MASEDRETHPSPGANPRRAVRTDATPVELAELFLPALDAVIEADEEQDT